MSLLYTGISCGIRMLPPHLVWTQEQFDAWGCGKNSTMGKKAFVIASIQPKQRKLAALLKENGFEIVSKTKEVLLYVKGLVKAQKPKEKRK